MLLFFSVARSAQLSQAERAKEANPAEDITATVTVSEAVPDGTEPAEKMPTDKLLDVSPLALRMSSPFNAGYWLTAA